jgi:predicted SnoaL-like aldol condensation-catalyzing enzyme
MGAEENKAVVRRNLEEVFNQRNVDVAEELFSPEYVVHPSLPASPSGPERIKRIYASMQEAFPDIRVDIESMIAEGDTVATRMSFSGTHVSTGKHARWPATLFSHLSGGLIVEEWFLTDSAQLEAQLE